MQRPLEYDHWIDIIAEGEYSQIHKSHVQILKGRKACLKSSDFCVKKYVYIVHFYVSLDCHVFWFWQCSLLESDLKIKAIFYMCVFT